MIMEPATFEEIVSGRRRGLSAGGLRGVLRAAEAAYSLAMRLRNWRYDLGRAAVHRVAVPVVCVGNLTLGGTGKTPMVAWLARFFRNEGVRVTLVSRGYGAEQGSRNDEALELEQMLPDVPHLQNRDRVAAARLAIEEFECQMILLDDGFQHRRLARDLDIVLLDATEPFGYGHAFPRGMLREPASALRRAGVVALSRADMVDLDRRRQIRQQVERYAPTATWIEVLHRPRALRSSSGAETAIDTLRGKRVAAFCGIGNPHGFRHTLESSGYQIAGFRSFADHYAYARGDVEALAHWAEELKVDAAVCTHKDLVKLGIESLGRTPLWALAVGLEFLSGRSELEARLRAVLPPPDAATV
jgi:tetraacyldisaccharide 4'-kinase